MAVICSWSRSPSASCCLTVDTISPRFLCDSCCVIRELLPLVCNIENMGASHFGGLQRGQSKAPGAIPQNMVRILRLSSGCGSTASAGRIYTNERQEDSLFTKRTCSLPNGSRCAFTRKMGYSLCYLSVKSRPPALTECIVRYLPA